MVFVARFSAFSPTGAPAGESRNGRKGATAEGRDRAHRFPLCADTGLSLGFLSCPAKIRRMWLSATLKGAQGSSRFERRSDQRMIEQQHDPLKVCR
jgi:hypothetical protein